MPEGPSIIILKELTQEFTGRKVISVSGKAKNDVAAAEGKKVTAIKS